MNRIETVILNNLFCNEEYARKTLPYINSDYFENNTEKNVFSSLNSFITKYNNLPTKEAIIIEVGEKTNISEDQYSQIVGLIQDLPFTPEPNQEWLIEQTEKFCQDKAIYNAIMKSVSIIDPSNKSSNDKGEIPKILQDALSISFDPNVGHDYLDNSDDRYDFYHRKEKKIAFDLDYFNKITDGGLPLKTLNIILAGTGVGKSLFMCHHAAACLTQGLNVLYISLEMAEERIAERIDANLMNVSLKDLGLLNKQMYDQKIEKLKSKIKGKLIVKEYPTASANTNHFRYLLQELYLKKSFKPDIIFIDYLNICTSSRIKPGSNINSYSYIKSIAEELRGLAVENEVPIVSATQTTRGGFSNTDIGLEDTSESFGLPATADFMFALVTNEELEDLNQILVKQLKNRYSDPSTYKRFVIGVDRAKMKLYDLEESAQKNVMNIVNDSKKVKKQDEYDDVPVFDVGTDNKFRKSDYSTFNF